MIECAKFQIDILKNAWVLSFWIQKVIFYDTVFWFSYFSHLGRSKSALGSFSCPPKNMYHTTQTQRLYFDLFDLVTSDDLDLAWGHQMLRRILWSIHDTIDVILSALFQLDTSTLPTKPVMTEGQKSDLGQTGDQCQQWPSDKISQRIRKVNARYYQTPF